MSNIVIDIAAQFTGKKAFKQAETSTEKLTKNVKKLAQAVGLGFGTAQVLAFGKASVKAALEAQAQQERLANLVKVTVGATDAQVQALNEQAAALQAIGVVNKENITQTQSQLATFNLQIDTIKTLTPAILDYVTAEKGAAASADQFKQMTNGLAQALNGNFASLTKVGFVLDEQTKKTIKSGTETERAAALVKVLDSTYKDFNKNYVAIWNDESHWNRYLWDFQRKGGDITFLDVSYVYPDSLIQEYYIPLWGKKYEPKIITLTKPFTLSKEAGAQLQESMGQPVFRCPTCNDSIQHPGHRIIKVMTCPGSKNPHQVEMIRI